MKSKLYIKNFLTYDMKSGIFYTLVNNLPAGAIGEDGYLYIWVDKNRYRADKLAYRYVTGEWPKYPLIHIDGVNSNNSWNNLKMVRTKKPANNNRSKVTGVFWSENDKSYRVQIYVNGKQESKGSYKNFDLAVMARYKAEVLYGYKPDSTAHQYIKKMFL